ncbi:MAG TPA: MBL fold metallo-hydrolase [Desulfonatronum sp.]|nr:MBL fold metallo-hydrolase [Desulfonatronum sp.]
MRVQFIGVGEAFDEHYPNTSILVSLGGPENQLHVLLDCGFTAAAAYYAHAHVGAALDAVWISHFHGDHFLGVPLLLLRFWEEGRTKPLTIMGQKGVEEKLWSSFDLAFPQFKTRLQYPVHCLEAAPGKTIELAGAQWSFTANDHSVLAPCLAVRLACNGKSVFYSGDGRPTPSTADLAQGVDLLIHEAYGLEPDTPGHGGVPGCLELAEKTRAKSLALVHVNRRVRQEKAGVIRDMLATALKGRGFLPEPGDAVAL